MACFTCPPLIHILKMSLFLLMLMWVALLVVDAKHHHRHHGTKAWDNEYLQERMSTMSHRSTKTYLRYVKKGRLSSHRDAFCKDARIVCESDADVSRETFTPSFYTDASPQLQRTYFQKPDILVGEEIRFQDVTNGLPFRAFLPQKLANKLPFSSDTLPRLLDMLSIRPDSNLAKEMEQTLATCEGSTVMGKGHKCVKSLEELAQFIGDNLGSNVHILQPTLHPAAEEQNLTTRDIALKGSPKSEGTVICSELMFSSLVLHCHVVEGVESIEVRLESEGEENEVYKGVVQCYKSRMTFVNRHFMTPQLLRGGQREMCHWSGVNELVIVKEVGEEGKKKRRREEEGVKAADEEEEEAMKTMMMRGSSP